MKEKKTLHKNIELKLYETTELPEKWKELCNLARQAANDAYAVYSSFRVGAAVLLEDGTILKGNNQENAAYPSGLCAERTVLFYTHANYPDKKILAIAIYSPDTQSLLTPCGACRQVLLEYEKNQITPIQTLIVSKEGIYIMSSAADWLPFEFSENQLR
ncbi:MAG: cytidine deaminase [Bacteroidia bacterium]